MTYRSWERGDPLEVLIRKGEGCDNCRHLERWSVGGDVKWLCENKAAPAKNRQSVPTRRCDEWRHEKQDGGQ